MDDKVKFNAEMLSALTKVFLDEKPSADPACTYFTALQNEVFSFQTVYYHNDWLSPFARVELCSPLKPYCRIRQVESVPCAQPVRAFTDDYYLRTAPGLYPDLLTDLDDGLVLFSATRCKSLWIDVEVPAGGPSGDFPLSVIFTSMAGEELCRAETVLHVYKKMLQEQRLLRSEWFHGDCLADYYRVPVFSEDHWRIMRNFVATAARRGCNMILTPQFTPPLDTAPGGERTTIQLIDVARNADGTYEFGFEKLNRWVAMCLECGITHFEMSHLFTQWGALHPPNIMAETEAGLTRIFGWESPAVGGEYTRFLSAYLPRLTEMLKKWGIDGVTRFHISDEPEESQLSTYKAARDSAAPYLEGFVIMDAISSLPVYREGGIECPVCANDCIGTFLEAGVHPLWSYYCTAQFLNVSNRFMAMPSARCRIYGVQAFLYGLEGILHWGYNFYNSKHSVYHLNPYRCTDAGGVFPSGDPFLVYPGSDGRPEESIRLMTMLHAMQDVRAMEQLADERGKEWVNGLIQEGLSSPVTFDCYPKSDVWLLRLRNRINEELSQR